MQAFDSEQMTMMQTDEVRYPTAAIPAMWVVVALLVVAAVLLRVAEIDTVPMSDAEAAQALAAWHTVSPDAPGNAQSASSPIVYWLQIASFSVLGATEFAARLPGIIGGIVLMLVPFLFHQQIGRDRALIASLLLALSPVAFVASRTADPAIWTLIFALVGMHHVWRFWQGSDTSAALQAILWFGAMALLTESGGLMLGLILAASAAAALWWVLLDAADVLDEPGDEAWQAIRRRLQAVPTMRGIGLSLASIVLLATGFMLHPAGLNAVGALIDEFVRGFFVPTQPDMPFAGALIALWVYEPILLIFGVIGAVAALRRAERPFVNRFFIVWSVTALVALALYRGATPADALWVVVPVIFLTSDVIAALLRNRDSTLLGFNITLDADKHWWAKWLLSIVILSVLLLMALNLQLVGRNLFDAADQTVFSMFLDVRFAQYRYSVIWLGIILLLLVMGYFLSGTIWGNANTWQGYGLGLFAFLLLTNIVTGWNTAVEHADDPAEIWHVTAVSHDAYLLRDTLYEVAQRTSRGFPTLPVTIVRDEAGMIRDDGLLAWLVRDFNQARFVGTAAEAQREGIVILVEDAPDLGGSYVGQSFALRERWSLEMLEGNEWLNWWVQRRIRSDDIVREQAILWLRQDIYNGVDSLN